MSLDNFSYILTVIFFPGLALLLYFLKRIYSPSRDLKLHKSDFKVIFLVILINVIGTGIGECLALLWQAWAYTPEKTFHYTLFGAELETYFFAIFVTLVVVIATIVHARLEDKNRKNKS